MAKRFYLFIISLSFLILFRLDAQTQKTLTLSEALKEAEAKNPDIKTAEQTLGLAKADIVSAKLRQNPSMNFISDIFPLPGQKFNPASKYFGANINFPLDVAGHRDYRILLSEKNLETQNILYSDLIRQLKYKIAISYYNVLAIREKLDLAREILDKLKSFVELNKIRAEQNEIPFSDVKRSEFIRDQYINEISSIDKDFKSVTIDLQTLMGRTEYVDSLALEEDIETLIQPDSITIEDAFNKAKHKRPDYLALIKLSEAETANLNLQKSYRSVDLSLQADYSKQQYTDFYGFTVNLTLPVFNRNEGEIEKSTIRIEQIRLQIKALESSIKGEIVRNYDNMKGLWDIVQNQSKNLLPKAEQILQSVEYSYKHGNTTLIDYLEAQRSFTQAKIDYIETLLEYHISRISFYTAISEEF